MSKKRAFVRRKWLNSVDDYSASWIKYGISYDTFGEGYLVVSEDNKTVELEFTKDEKGLKKLELLIASLEELSEEMRVVIDG